MPSPPPLVGRAALFGNLAVIATLWGSSFILLKMLAEVFPPFTVAALRAGTASVAIILMFLVTGRSLRPSRADLKAAAVMGALHGFLPNGLVAYGVAGPVPMRAPSAEAQANGRPVCPTIPPAA